MPHTHVIKPYDRTAALAYAKEWSFKRNPRYYDFSEIGGDCTNFISQCLYAGGCIMNFTPDVGWYCTNISNRSAAWTGVPFFYKFMTTNQGIGPFATEVEDVSLLLPGDIIQFGNPGRGWHHSLLVLITGCTYDDILVATHTFDAYGKPLSDYLFTMVRFLHIEGTRTN